jgi:hypothetical protein
MMKQMTMFALALLVVASSASAATIVPGNSIAMKDLNGWGTGTTAGPATVNFADAAYSTAVPTPLAGCVGTAGLSMSSNLTPNAATNRFNAKGWNVAGQYIDFLVTTKSGQGFIADKLYVGLKSSSTGPGTIDVMFSKDGGAWTAIEAGLVSPGTSYVNKIYDLSALIGTVSSSLDIRFYGGTLNTTGGAIATTGTFSVGQYSDGTNYTPFGVTGTATSVPEPATMAILGFGGMLIARRRRA